VKQVKNPIKQLAALACAAVIAGSGALSLAARAGEPYENYNYDRWGEAIPSQAGYTPDRAVSGRELGVGDFDAPSDIFCDSDDIFYIADTKNDRIVTVDADFTGALRVYDTFIMPDGSTTELSSPKGIFVSAVNGYMYIADSENDRVLVSDKEARVQFEITRPDSELFTAPTFKPQKVIADKAGNVYVVLGNITTGAALFSPKGEFSGFYGANRVQPTAEIIGSYLKNLFTSEEKRSRRTRNVPTGITSFDIDGDFIFTCTSSSSQSTDTVKKLNAAGKNIFADLALSFGDTTPVYDTAHNAYMAPAIVDIDIAADGNINCLDYTTGRIFQYDEDCNLLFITGAKADQLGGFNTPAALESHGTELYVVDSTKDTVTIFRETSFGAIVHKAAALYNDGYHEEALEPWYEVLRRDGNYRRAQIGVALALLRKGDYEGSMKYAKLAGSSSIYNRAFEGYRREFLKRHFTAIAAVIAAAAALMIYLSRRKKKRREPAGVDIPEEAPGKEE
jgi:DNA-binding beta-propeller fold protein YncE